MPCEPFVVAQVSARKLVAVRSRRTHDITRDGVCTGRLVGIAIA